MPMQHLFVIDPLPTLNKDLDSSLRLMFELSRRGHEIYTSEPRQLAWTNGEKCAHAHSAAMRFEADATHFSTGGTVKKSLADFAAVHMRKDPPYDLDYIATTWLLESATGFARIYNAPTALRSFNEKLAIFRFENEVKPALVSANPDEILQFIEEQGGDAVLKPLTLFGGRGVERVQLHEGTTDKQIALEFVRKETVNGTNLRLVQAFDQAIYAGEVRAFTAFGKPVAWCLKKPAAGNFLANTRAGAQLLAYQPKPIEIERVTKVAKALQKDGVVFIGFDLIGGYISEINITSPRLLQGPEDKSNYYKGIAEQIELDLQG